MFLMYEDRVLYNYSNQDYDKKYNRSDTDLIINRNDKKFLKNCAHFL